MPRLSYEYTVHCDEDGKRCVNGPVAVTGYHRELSNREYELYKDQHGTWHGDVIAFGEYGILTDSDAQIVAEHFELE